MITTYDGPSVTARRTGACPTCDKKTTRTTRISATVNPFNKNPDGTPKTWRQVHEDVTARAQAWEPEPAVFEHEACRAGRLAPPAADPQPIAYGTLVHAAKVRDVMRTVIDRTERENLPLGRVEVSARPPGEQHRVSLGFLAPGHFLAWARAFATDTVRVETADHATYARLYVDADGIRWDVHTSISRPDAGDRLGGAQVEWHRYRSGRRGIGGTVTVDELAAGLARMGIAEITTTVTA